MARADLARLVKRYRLREPVYVTRTHLPELGHYCARLKGIWKKRWVTNNGDAHAELEQRLCGRLGVPFVSLQCNGTLSLMLALRALELEGEVLTTPFTFPATPNAILWSGLKPVFCDIDPATLNIDPEKVEAAVTEKTSAILAVHVFGAPCDVDALADISRRRGLRLVYDAAHAFGVRVKGRPVAAYGDLTAFSFHATKLFHTIEGGALAAHDARMKKRLDLLRNFGIEDEETVRLPGINAKMNELQAAMGLLELECVDEEIGKRQKAFERYLGLLGGLPGLKLPAAQADVEPNHMYFPVLIDRAECPMDRDGLYAVLKEFNVFARKYFHPLCSNFDFYAVLPSASRQSLPVSNRVSESVLCLPLSGEMDPDAVEAVCLIIRKLLGG